jgi:LL-diaminopimelate aminotransferase
MESYIQSLIAERIGGSRFGKDEKIYKFEKIKRAKRAALAENPGSELIDLGVGEPDEKAFDIVIDKLREESGRHENRGYADNGIQEFKDSAARYLKNVYGVDNIDPEKEIIHAIGSKTALAMLPSAFINPGDVVIMTTPGYPVLGLHAEWYGGRVHNCVLEKKNAFLPALESIPPAIKEQAKIMVINYPNNPTGADATPGFYEKIIAFAKENKILIVQDSAYSALSYKREKPLSFLSIPGAKDVGVEIFSLSKAFNMTGWRMAFLAGNELAVHAFANIKDNNDSGQFKAIQKAAALALDHPEITVEIKKKYARRLKELSEILRKLGFDASMPDGTFYLYVEIPKGIKRGRRFESGEDFSQFLIKEKLISSVPWDDAGGFVRFSATFEAKDIDDEARILKEIETRLSSLSFEF